MARPDSPENHGCPAGLKGDVMPKFIVKATTIVHARKGDKASVEYKPGQEIELTEDEAGLLKHNLESAGKGNITGRPETADKKR